VSEVRGNFQRFNGRNIHGYTGVLAVVYSSTCVSLQ